MSKTKAATKRGPGRPAIPEMSITLDTYSPKGASVRFDVNEKNDANPVFNVYLNRTAFAGLVPDGHIPVKVEATFRILKTAEEPKAE